MLLLPQPPSAPRFSAEVGAEAFGLSPHPLQPWGPQEPWLLCPCWALELGWPVLRRCECHLGIVGSQCVWALLEFHRAPLCLPARHSTARCAARRLRAQAPGLVPGFPCIYMKTSHVFPTYGACRFPPAWGKGVHAQPWQERQTGRRSGRCPSQSEPGFAQTSSSEVMAGRSPAGQIPARLPAVPSPPAAPWTEGTAGRVLPALRALLKASECCDCISRGRAGSSPWPP